MLRTLTKRGWRDHIASLQRRAAVGDVRAMTDLGVTLLEGIQDRKARSLARRNPRAALMWLRNAAGHGDACPAWSLGYAYDVGLGTPRDEEQAIRWYRRAVTLGSAAAASNLATVYRDAGKARLAHKWWLRSAAMGDGDSAVDVGYGYQYGIGTRRDPVRAKHMFKRAVASRNISQYAREAAMYHLALQLVDEGNLRLAVPLLKQATADDDYPEAASVLRQLEADSAYVPCRCRRGINTRLLGHAKCELHPR